MIINGKVLAERILNHLKEEIENLLAWEKESADYLPHYLRVGITVVVSKHDKDTGNPASWYCKHCFDSGKKSELQRSPLSHTLVFCPECKTDYPITDEDRINLRKARGFN